MEKIKQALEKARKERGNLSRSEGELGTNDSEQILGSGSDTANADLSDIVYNQTQSVKIPNEILRNNRILSAMEPGEFTNAIKILRTQILQRMEENNWNTLAVTSPAQGEGKTLTAINLAISLAMEVSYTVLLVDTNLTHPNLHEFFGIKPKYGLRDYLINNKAIEEILVKPDGIDHFVILPGSNTLVHNSSEMLGSPKMKELVEELKNKYPKRMIIFDLPPLLSTADALAFIPRVDATLLVAEDDKTKAQDLTKAVDILSITNIIGTVLNKKLY